MKFDIVRAWKDESYRQSLSEEQLNTLPTNPVGELSDAQLESVYGGDGFGGPAGGLGGGVGPGLLGGPGFLGAPLGGFGVGASQSASAASAERIHSFSGFCDVNIFSANLISLSHLGLVNVLSPTTQICANND